MPKGENELELEVEMDVVCCFSNSGSDVGNALGQCEWIERPQKGTAGS